jgi:hypothetical protein
VQQHPGQEGHVPGHLGIGEGHALRERVQAQAGEGDKGQRLPRCGVHMAMLDTMAEELKHHLQQESPQYPQADAVAYLLIQLR